MVPTKAGFDIDAETHHQHSGTHRFEYDLDDTPPCMAVVSALSSVLDVCPTEMKPIGESIDTDALNGLLGSVDGAEVSWTQAGHEVTVSSDGSVDVSPADDAQPSVER